jgi:O-antigen/teichoic acid export membrane protein
MGTQKIKKVEKTCIPCSLAFFRSSLFFFFLHDTIGAYIHAPFYFVSIPFISLKRKILLNTTMQMSARAVSVLLGVVAFGVMARYLGPEGFGWYTTTMAFLNFFGIFADFGLSLVAIQLMSEKGYDPEKSFQNIFTFRLITAIFFLGIAPLVALFFPYPPEIKIGIAITTASIFFSSLIQMYTVAYQVRISMFIPVVADILGRVITIGGILYAMIFDQGFFFILTVIALNNAIQVIILHLQSSAYAHVRLACDWQIWKDIFKRSWPIGLSIIFNIIYLKADSVFLSLWRPQAEVGIYGAAYNVIQVFTALPFLFIGLTLGSYSSAWSQGNMPLFQKYIQKSFDFLMLIALPLVTGTFFLARPVMTLIAGQSFEQAGDILKVLILAVGAIFLSVLFGSVINVIHKQKMMLVGYVAGAVIGIVGYIVTIPSYSYWGAAWITVLSEFSILVFAFLVFYQKTRISISLSFTGKTFLASCAMALFLFFFHGHVMISIFLAAGIYACALFLIGGISKNDIVLFFKKPL